MCLKACRNCSCGCAPSVAIKHVTTLQAINQQHVSSAAAACHRNVQQTLSITIPAWTRVPLNAGALQWRIACLRSPAALTCTYLSELELQGISTPFFRQKQATLCSINVPSTKAEWRLQLARLQVSPACCDLLRKMLTVTPAQRITIRKHNGVPGIYDHPWFAAGLPAEALTMNDGPPLPPAGYQVTKDFYCHSVARAAAPHGRRRCRGFNDW